MNPQHVQAPPRRYSGERCPRGAKNDLPFNGARECAGTCCQPGVGCNQQPGSRQLHAEMRSKTGKLRAQSRSNGQVSAEAPVLRGYLLGTSKARVAQSSQAGARPLHPALRSEPAHLRRWQPQPERAVPCRASQLYPALQLTPLLKSSGPKTLMHQANRRPRTTALVLGKKNEVSPRTAKKNPAEAGFF